MTINRIPLNERITRLRCGYPSDSDYVLSAIHTLADIPIAIYLGSDSTKMKELSCLLEIAENHLIQLSYTEVASCVSALYDKAKNKDALNDIIEILTIPLLLRYEERKKYYGVNGKNIT